MKARTITFIIATISAAFFNFAYAAETIVRGRINDKTTGESEIGAVVQFFKASEPEKPIAYTITDAEGNFSHPLDVEGEYVLLFTNVGRKEYREHFVLRGESELDLGTILVEDDIQMLEAGRVVALKDLVKMDVDLITYKVEDDVDSKSITLLDMLRKVPMVTVDAQDNILVNGNSNFQVLVDGKPNVMMSNNPSQVFKSLPASFARDIQVITNPGVKYDAEGIGGVLNITTNRELGVSGSDLDGYNANINLGVGTINRQGSGYVTVQKGKFSASGQLSIVDTEMPETTSESIQEQLDGAGNVLSSVKTVSSTFINTPIRIASASLGYQINEMNLISATLGYTSIASHTNGSNSTSLEAAGALPHNYTSSMKSVWDINNINAGIDYQKSFRDNSDKLLVFSYQFSSSPSVTDSESLFDDSLPGLADRYTDGMTNTLQHSIQVDFTSKISSGLGFNAGAKYINRLNKSDQSLFLDKGNGWEQDLGGSLIYRHDNNIVAGYGEMSYGKGKLSGKGGIRYEHTFQDVEYKLGNGANFRLDYGNLVPAASLQYNIGHTQNLGLTYNMRISRPGITYLNPYVDISDPTAKNYGNPELETERAHNIALVYNFFSQNIIVNINARVNYTGNAIQQYRFYDQDGILNTTFGNVAKKSSSGISAMLMYNKGKTRLVLNTGVNYSDMCSEKLQLHNYGWSANAIASIQTSLPWDIRFSSNVIWTSGTRSLDGWNSGIAMVTTGLNRSFLSERLTLSLSGVTPINIQRCLISETSSSGTDYRSHTISRIPMSTVTATISWSFGSNRNASVRKTRKTITNDDLIDMSNRNEKTSSLINLQ
ncbi:MAG: TonB-dependent receptor domain-containing protein [Candidatus Cryptobacteroides sp.]